MNYCLVALMGDFLTEQGNDIDFYKHICYDINMFEFTKSILSVWNSEKNQRLKLQYAYIILAILGLATAGLLTLFNISSAHLAASISGILFITFLVNGVTWGIIEAFITPKLPKESSASTKKPSRKR